MATVLYVGLWNAALATLLAGLVFLATRIWRRPALAHGLWLLVLVKLLLPPIFEAPLPSWVKPEVFAAPMAASEEAAPPADVPVLDDVTFAEPPLVLPEGEALSGPAAEPPPRIAAIDQEPATPIMANVADAPGEWAAAAQTVLLEHWREALAATWVAGTLAWLLLALVRVGRFHHALRHAEPAPAAVRIQAAMLAEEMGLRSCPPIYFVPGHVSPMLWALTGRARILLPRSLWAQLSPEQQQTLLLHELAHVRRRDHWVRVVETLATALYWWHPVAWWARRELREAEEACCDAWVTATLPAARQSYATALLATVDFLAGVRRPLPLAASGIGRVRHLRRRLTMIMNGTTSKSLSWHGCLALVVASLALLPVLPTWAQEPPRDRPPEPPDRPGRQDPPPDRGRAELPPRGPLAPNPDVRDHLERLEAMLQVKHAEIRRAEVAVNAASDAFSTLGSAGPAASEAERRAARNQLDAARADLDVKRAEARVVEVEIAQARRRLGSGDAMGRGRGDRVAEPPRDHPGAPTAPAPGGPPMPPAGAPGHPVPPSAGATPVPGAPVPLHAGPFGPGGPPGGFPPGSPAPFAGGASRDFERRLEEVEKKLNRLLEELEKLRTDPPRLRSREEERRPSPPTGGGGRREPGAGAPTREDPPKP